ncbi:uncharacterized protein [Amphiura filiformis]|uniref:uncharacterized protein n=1 Tax=Amphiura filiformis TaxID=82378 RepID=UPI003B210E7B
MKLRSGNWEDNSVVFEVDSKQVANNGVINVLEGVNVTFDCSVPDVLPSADINLDFGGEPAESRQSVSRAFTADTTVTCTGSNERGSASVSITVTIAEPYDCTDILIKYNYVQRPSGAYYIYPNAGSGKVRMLVWCDMKTDGGGWTVFQRREDGSVDFFLDWAQYKNGFGDVKGEHWLGNDQIYTLSNNVGKRYELRVDLDDGAGATAFSVYSSFSIDTEGHKYALTLGAYDPDGNSTGGDALSRMGHGEKFSTKDADNDEHSGVHCAKEHTGGWWYHRCYKANLNGKYLGGDPGTKTNGVAWRPWKGFYSLAKTEMKLRSGYWQDNSIVFEVDSNQVANKHALEGVPVAFDCSVPGVTPSADITLDFGGEIENSPSVSRAFTADTTVTCTGSNEHGSASVSITVTIAEPYDCNDILNTYNDVRRPSGAYYIYPNAGSGKVRMLVWCDMETDGGGWTVFQRREDGSVDFYLDWAQYKKGFGDVKGEHWLGNDNIYILSNNVGKRYELRVDLDDGAGATAFAVYSSFSIDTEEHKYALTLGAYDPDSNSTAGDALSGMGHGEKFSTKDADNDKHSGVHCAQKNMGGWWYHSCYKANLNGKYLGGDPGTKTNGVAWKPWKGFYSLAKTEMKLRP